MKWRKREVLPTEISALELAKGERLLAWCPIDAGAGFAAATTTRFVLLPSGGDGQEWQWDRIAHGQWEEDRLTLTAPDSQGVRRTTEIAISEPGGIPLAVRERVSATMVADYERVLPAGVTARFIARRAIGADNVRWTVMFAPGVDTADPVIRSQADAELAELKSTLGL